MADENTDTKMRAGEAAQKCRIIVIGAQMAKRVQDTGGLGDRVEVAARYADLAEWEAGSGKGEKADLVIAECPTLFPETIALIKECTGNAGAMRAIVVYHFCQDSTRGLMEERVSGITALRAPVTPEELKFACESDLALAMIRSSSLFDEAELPEQPAIANEESQEEIPARQFSDEDLSELASISSTVACECPHHMASLLTALNAFEDYSRECENKNLEDAALHAFLHRRTARARAIMEDALVALAEAEGIKVG